MEGEKRILLALYTEDHELPDFSVFGPPVEDVEMHVLERRPKKATSVFEAELFAKDMGTNVFGQKRGIGYSIEIRCIDGPRKGVVNGTAACWYSPYDIFKKWDDLTGNPCPISAERIIRLGREAVGGLA